MDFMWHTWMAYAVWFIGGALFAVGLLMALVVCCAGKLNSELDLSGRTEK
jgi:hypothetical protein